MEFAVDPGVLTPSVREVETLLAQDRVRQALERANVLASLYRGPQTDLAYGWAMWRNGDVRGAEPRFRRSAAAGFDGGHVGLAAVSASAADWDSVVDLVGQRSSGVAHALLASAAWVGGDREAAARHLSLWNAAEPRTARGRAAASMAAAVARLGGTLGWEGDPVVLSLQALESGGWAVPANVGGRDALLRIDLTFRQSALSQRFVQAAGIEADGPESATRTPSRRWPSILSPRQAAVERIDFGAAAVRDVVVGVGIGARDVDGVLGADILSAARWTMVPARGELRLAPPGRAPAEEDPDATRTIAWLSGRLVREGTTAQLLLFPRVENTTVAAGVDFGAASRLDSDLLPVQPGSSGAPAELMLGGWRGAVDWRAASLAGWGIDGGVAPTAVIGANVLSAWSLHWYPASAQLRVDAAPRTAAR